MREENGTWKIDNIILEPFEKMYLDYSRPASYYDFFPDGEEPDITEDIILPETEDIVY